LAQPSASNAASTLLVAIKTNVMERSPIGEGGREKRSQDRPPVLFKKRKPAVLRENSGLGYISNDSDQVPEKSSGLWSAV
jgi:hypothetical protein